MFGLKLIDNAKAEFHRLWSVRVTLFLIVLNGTMLGLSGFVDVLKPQVYMALNIVGYSVLGIARLIKQKDVVK